MDEKGLPYVGDIKINVAHDGGHAVFDIITGPESKTYAVTQDILMLMIGKLQHLNVELAKKRRQIDPRAGKAGDIVPLAAIRPTSILTASVPDSYECGIIFESSSGPQAFALTRTEMVELAHRLLLEAERSPTAPRLSS